MRSLIIGITGCAGSHLADHLLAKGQVVWGTKRETSSTAKIRHLQERIPLLEMDLASRESIKHVLGQSRPDFVYFLASARPAAAAEEFAQTNVWGLMAFFEALVTTESRPRTIFVSSGAVYGPREDGGMIAEDAPLAPLGRYGLAKVLQEQTATYFRRRYALDIITVRPFNYSGPREDAGLVCSDFAKQIVAIEHGTREAVIKAGALDTARDFLDVRDVVTAYALLAAKGRSGEVYNVCSGKAYKIQEILAGLAALSKTTIALHQDSTLFRPAEVRTQVGNNSKITRETGWSMTIPLKKMLADVLDYHRREESKWTGPARK